MEMDFDFVDTVASENKQAASLSSNGNKEKKELKKKCTLFFNLVLYFTLTGDYKIVV
jgi:hypothetical protein